MISYTAWVTANGATAAERAAEAARHAADSAQVIADKPISIVFRTAAGVTLAAQIVRLDSDSGVSEAESAAGTAPRRKVTITAPATADIKERYEFVLDNDKYRVVDVIPGVIGELQIKAEAIG